MLEPPPQSRAELNTGSSRNDNSVEGQARFEPYPATNSSTHRGGNDSETCAAHALSRAPSRVVFWAGATETRLQVCSEGQQTAVAVLHHKLARVPRRIGKSARKFHASSRILSVKRVGILDEDVCVEQFVRIFVGIGGGRFGAAEVNRLLVAHNDRVNRRVLPCA